MADGFIVRRGGKVSEQALAPTITKVSETNTSITFTLKNNDAETATLVYRVSSLTGDGESISVAADTTTSNITVSGLDRSSAITLFVTANVTGKVKSNVTEANYDAIVFTAATGGTTEGYNLDGKRYKSHTFTSDGDFVVTTAGNGDRNQVDYLIIAGGGGGGGVFGRGAGGGGAGGYLTTLGATSGNVANKTKFTVTATTFGVVVGAGGLGGDGSASDERGFNGNHSSAFGETATGGGGGGGSKLNSTDINGRTGGSGGGGAATSITQTTSGGAGTSGQGFSGGDGAGDGATQDVQVSGGGGGASAVGVNGNKSNSLSGNGGNGLANLLRTGSNETRAGGGGGGKANTVGSSGTGGTGGGGNGSQANSGGSAGTVNTGGGGGGAGDNTLNARTGFAGGAGIVVIRYEIAPSV
jgi:hypothetical protein